MEERKIKICHVANTGRAVKFLLLPQLEFLIKEGYDVYVVCSSEGSVDEIEKKGIKVKSVKMKRKVSPFSDLVVLVKLFLYFKKEKFQIVHVHNPKPSILGQLAAKMAGTPIIINTIHGLYFHENSSKIKKSIFVFIEKIAAKCSDLIFSQNEEDMITLVKERIAKPEKIRYLGNGIDIDKFDVNRFSQEFIYKKKKEIDIPEDYLVIGIVARLVEEKGYSELFKAFEIVLKRFAKTILLIIGPEEPEKKDAINPKIVKEYNIEENVIFLGERSDVDEIYPLMDIFVLPSHREGFPRSILEAMAEKRAVLATNIRGCREEIENGRNGILVPVKDSDKLAEMIIFLFNNPTKAKELGEDARLKVEKYFNEKLVFNKISESYQNLIKKYYEN